VAAAQRAGGGADRARRGLSAVLVAGPNLTIDRTLTGAALRPGEVLRFDAHAGPGGKGLNVARGAQALGAEALLVALLPGHTGAAVGALIGEERSQEGRDVFAEERAEVRVEQDLPQRQCARRAARRRLCRSTEMVEEIPDDRLQPRHQ